MSASFRRLIGKYYRSSDAGVMEQFSRLIIWNHLGFDIIFPVRKFLLSKGPIRHLFVVSLLRQLIEKIGAREDIGDLLADGIIPTSQKWGVEDLAIHVKGLEPAGYDPRALKGMGLTFGTAPRGACHLRTTFYKPELSGMIPPEQIEGKAEMLVDYEDRLNIFDTLTLCRFYRDIYTWEELEKTIQMVTGEKTTQESLRARAAHVATMTRRFNVQEGFTAADDQPAQETAQRCSTGGWFTFRS